MLIRFRSSSKCSWLHLQSGWAVYLLILAQTGLGPVSFSGAVWQFTRISSRLAERSSPKNLLPTEFLPSWPSDTYLTPPANQTRKASFFSLMASFSSGHCDLLTTALDLCNHNGCQHALGCTKSSSGGAEDLTDGFLQQFTSTTCLSFPGLSAICANSTPGDDQLISLPLPLPECPQHTTRRSHVVVSSTLALGGLVPRINHGTIMSHARTWFLSLPVHN